MANNGQPSSYTNITAAEASGTETISYTEIQSAVNQRDKMGFLKLMWAAGANAAMVSQQLEFLEVDRQQLKEQFDRLSLALAELRNTPLKDEEEQQQQQRLAVCNEMEEALVQVKNKLDELNREITYYNDYNEDRQIKFRETMSQDYQKLDKLVEEKIDIILNVLKENNIKTDKPESEVRNILRKALNNPELQEAYIQAAGQVERKGFTEKLKGWLTS
jgi:chromosome condensin MukBEF ATPase and DNA-binding subunit MukB